MHFANPQRLVLIAMAATLPAVAGEAASPHSSIDLVEGWRFRPDPQSVGAAEQWFSADHADDGWVPIEGGKRWEDQGYPELDGHAWYRMWVEIPEGWQGKRIWITFGGVNDSYVLYCNGTEVASYGDQSTFSASKMGTTTELTECLRAGEPNLIALDVYDWALSGGLWRVPCLLTTDPANLPVAIALEGYADYEERQILAQVNLTGLGSARPDASLRIDLYREGRARPIASNIEVVDRDQPMVWSTFSVRNRKRSVTYIVRVSGYDTKGAVIPGTVTEAAVTWPGALRVPPEYADAKVLNNFVAELLHTTCPKRGERRYAFTNPRKGWVFIALQSSGTPGTACVFLDDSPDPLVLRSHPDTGAREAMRHLPEGPHTLRVFPCSGQSLVVRSVPEMFFCRYPLSPAIPEHGVYDWDYMTRHVLSNVNAIVTHYKAELPADEFEQWLREGRKWVQQVPLAGLHQPEPPTPDEVYQAWADKQGTVDPRYAGLIVDEFINAGTLEYYRPWSAGLLKLCRDPNFADKTFYAWCGLMANFDATADFRPVILENDHRFVWEQYMPEQTNELEARCYLHRRFVSHTRQWQESDPGAAAHLIQCLGSFCAPPATLDLDPSIDYKVHMDLQFRILATDPALWGQAGVMEWTANYADEEVLRWLGRLHRHYCIEGNRTPLSADPYVLPHLTNPDFDRGTQGWTLNPARQGAIEVRHTKGFGKLQGRYGIEAAGNHYLCMKQSPEGPNEVRQEVKHLVPGRMYSLKLIAADLTSREGAPPLSISIQGGALQQEGCFESRYEASGAFARVDGHPFRPIFTYFRFVFQASAPIAELVIADRPAAHGEEGHVIALNFVELQPYVRP